MIDVSAAAVHHSLSRRACVLFGAVLVTVNVVLLNHDFTVDGLAWAQAVDEGSGLFHPNHLLFNALHWLWFEFLRLLGLAGDKSVWSLQLVNVLAGCVAAVLVAHLASQRTGMATALSVAVFTMAGFAFWAFSQEPEVYILPGLLVVTSVWLIQRHAHLTMRHTAILALLATLAILLLQQYVLWYPVLLWLFRDRAPISPGQRRAAWWLLILFPPLACLGVYVLLGLMAGDWRDLDAVLTWFLGYGYQAEVGITTYREAPALLQRVLSLMLGLGNLLFAYEVVLADWSLIAAVVVALLLILAIGRAVLPWRAARAGTAGAVLVFGTFNLLFAFWWEARNIEFLLPVWISLALFVALRADRLMRVPWFLAVIGLVVVNTLVSMYPQRDWPQRYQQALELARHERLGAGDWLMTEELNTVRWLNYFHDVSVGFIPGAISIKTHAEIDPEAVVARIDAVLAAGGRVYTTEPEEHGRLRAIAQRFASVGRIQGQSVADILHDLYSRYSVTMIPQVKGAFQVCPLDREPVHAGRAALANGSTACR